MATEKRTPRPGGAHAHVHATGEALRDLVVEQVAEKIEQKLAASATKTAAKQQKLSAKADKAARQLDRLSAQLEALDVWTRTEPGGRRPRFTRDEIAAAAVRIADDEGFAALSMRRLAAELDAATMTIYHYVRDKDELLALVTDAVMGEVVLPPDEQLPTEWRAAVTVIATRSRDVLRRHPWTMDITDDPAIGPNSVRHFDQTLQAVSELDVDLTTKLDIVTAVDEYVFGYCINQRNNFEESGGFDDTMTEYVTGLIDTGDYPALTALTAEIGLEVAWRQIETHMRDTTRFDRNLSRLLDGIAAAL